MQLPCEMTRRFLYQNIKSVFLWAVILQIIFYCIYTCTFSPHFLQLAYKNFKNNKYFKATWLHSLIVFNIFLYRSTGHKWKKKRAIKISLTEQCFVGNHTKPEWNIASHNSVCFNQIIPAGLLGGNTQFVQFIKRLHSEDSSQSPLISCKSTPLEQWVWKHATALPLEIPVQYLLRDLDLDTWQGNQNLSLSDESDNYYGKQG